jgi:hypothetical protein
VVTQHRMLCLHKSNSPAEEGWIVANDKLLCKYVAA